METRASYIAVGAFFLILLLGGIVFALWASKYSSSTVMVNHYLRVDGSVAGLNTGSAVLFGGIPIGKVTKIVIDPLDPTLTRIDMTVRADAPIKTDSVGVLASKSLIGGAIIAAGAIDNWTVVRFAGSRGLPAATTAWRDAVFNQPLSFYLFDLPFYSVLRSYFLAVIIVCCELTAFA
jgi:hypothetical protein